MLVDALCFVLLWLWPYQDQTILILPYLSLAHWTLKGPLCYSLLVSYCHHIYILHRPCLCFSQCIACFILFLSWLCVTRHVPDSKVHGANMGPTWVLSAPDGPHVGPVNLAIWGFLLYIILNVSAWFSIKPAISYYFHLVIASHNAWWTSFNGFSPWLPT